MIATIIWDSTGPPRKKKGPATANRRAKRQAGKRAQLRLDDTPAQCAVASRQTEDV